MELLQPKCCKIIDPKLWNSTSHQSYISFDWTVCQENASGLLCPLTGQLWVRVSTWGHFLLLFHSHSNAVCFFVFVCLFSPRVPSWPKVSMEKVIFYHRQGAECQNITQGFHHHSASQGKLRFYRCLEPTRFMWWGSALLISCFRVLNALWLWKHLLTHSGRRRAGSDWTAAWTYYNSIATLSFRIPVWNLLKIAVDFDRSQWRILGEEGNCRSGFLEATEMWSAVELIAAALWTHAGTFLEARKETSG